MGVVDGEERCIDLLNDVLVNAHAPAHPRVAELLPAGLRQHVRGGR